jgi:hypothetical protein
MPALAIRAEYGGSPPRGQARLDMRNACLHVGHMSKMIQIRNVADELQRKLRVRAARAGMSLSQFLLGEVGKVAERPSVAEVLNPIQRRRPVGEPFDSAAAPKRWRCRC